MKSGKRERRSPLWGSIVKKPVETGAISSLNAQKRWKFRCPGMRFLLVIVWGLGLGLAAFEASAKDKVSTAAIDVDGIGLLHDREIKQAIRRLWGDSLGSELTTNQIEDAALFIASNLSTDGFQRPTISVEATLVDGSVQRFTVDPTLQTLPPPDLHATKVRFNVDKGIRSYLEDVKIEGLGVLKQEVARDFFFNEIAVIRGRAARAYSKGRLERSADAIESTLKQRGYAEATVRIVDTKENEKTGAVVATVQVNEGPRWDLASIRTDVDGPEAAELEILKTRKDIPWSVFRGQDLSAEIRQMYYKKGYPDVRVRIETRPGPPVNRIRPVEIVAHIHPGTQVGVGTVRFTGQERTRESVLRRRVQISPGDPLNPLALEKARYRLGRLGVFHSIDLTYQPPDGPVRDPVFILSEEKTPEVSLMAGYGSYEQLRGGVEVVQRNLFGRAHQSRLQLVQSFKSSRGDYTYSVPEIFGESIDGSARLFGLQREERAFLRQEYGATLTLKRNFPGLGADGTIGYTFQSLKHQDDAIAVDGVTPEQQNVGSIDLSLTHDGRDNPLRPTRGYRWFAQAELASRRLGGEVDYERFELGAAYHTSWGKGRWIHLGLSHGFVIAHEIADRKLILNKLFFPGGESSIRGFPEGEASPRGEAADGSSVFTGAKSYLLANVELEQGLTKSWSVVAFTDGVGIASSLNQYPFDTEMVSVGLGLRYQTLIGPVRLEYGHNVRKRAEDPQGALHFSLGFPF